MIRALLVAFFLVVGCISFVAATTAKPVKLSRLRRVLQERRLLDFPCLLGRVIEDEPDEQPSFPYWFCELDPRDADGIFGVNLPVQGLDLTEEEEAEVVDGATTLFADGYYVDEEENIIVIPPDSEPILEVIGGPPPPEFSPSASTSASASGGSQASSEEPEFLFQGPPTSFGRKTVMAIRVTARDIESSHSPQTMSEEIFGIGGDRFNMVTQFDACSYGQFTISPFDGRINGERIRDGVYETSIDVRAEGMSKYSLEYLVTMQLIEELGNSWYTRAGIDHVMYCLPTNDFTAYAYFNRYLSVYSDGWCLFPSGHMHELGHNLNLQHSNEDGFTYRDQTGLMGFSYLSDDFPEMCFNGPKSWQLGWYQDRHETIDAGDTWRGELVGVADYDRSRGRTVLLRITTFGFNDDYYVAFNRADGINAETQEAPDRVTVTSQFRNSTSCIMAKLDDSGEYGITDLLDSDVVLVQVDDILFREPAFAEVTVKVNEPPVARCDSLTLDSSGGEVCVLGSRLGRRSTDDSKFPLDFSPYRLCFDKPGTQNYRLRVTDAYGLDDVCTGKVTVVGIPEFSMSFDYSLSMSFSMSMHFGRSLKGFEDIANWDVEFGRTISEVSDS